MMPAPAVDVAEVRADLDHALLGMVGRLLYAIDAA
jgi:hypothetical protein